MNNTKVVPKKDLLKPAVFKEGKPQKKSKTMLYNIKKETFQVWIYVIVEKRPLK